MADSRQESRAGGSADLKNVIEILAKGKAMFNR